MIGRYRSSNNYRGGGSSFREGAGTMVGLTVHAHPTGFNVASPPRPDFGDPRGGMATPGVATAECISANESSNTWESGAGNWYIRWQVTIPITQSKVNGTIGLLDVDGNKAQPYGGHRVRIAPHGALIEGTISQRECFMGTTDEFIYGLMTKDNDEAVNVRPAFRIHRARDLNRFGRIPTIGVYPPGADLPSAQSHVLYDGTMMSIILYPLTGSEYVDISAGVLTYQQYSTVRFATVADEGEW